MNPPLSIVTIVKSRVRQLTNLIRSIEQAAPLPLELVVVWMAPPCSESLITSNKFDIVHKFVAHDNLPIPKARNKGFQACRSDNIVYMDVDCICPAGLFGHISDKLRRQRVVTAQMRYLFNVPEKINYPSLLNQAITHPNSGRHLIDQDTGFEQFHTMLFAITRQDYNSIDGFDENYVGFGVGDVDFATRCEQAGMSLYVIADKVLHQFHPRVEPPINHLFDIVNNASLYRQKWGFYPIQNWLEEFAREGLVNEDFHTEGLKVRRLPTKEEIAAHMTTRPY